MTRRRIPNRQPASPKISKRIQKIAAGAGAVIAGLVGVTTLIDWGTGTLDKDEPPPPASIDAQIVSVQRRAGSEALGDYIRSTKPPGNVRYSPEQLTERGYIVAVRVRIRGGQGQVLPLRWSLYDVERGRLKEPTYNQIGVKFAPLALEHARTWPVWLPAAPDDREYFVRFTLEDPEGRPVDTKDTPSFSGPVSDS